MSAVLALNARMEADYRSGSVSASDFSLFYLDTLRGRSPAEWAPRRRRFLHSEVLPRIPAAASDLVQHHRALGHTLVLTTATNRVITELTAQALDIPHLIATEAQLHEGLDTGRPEGVLNMHEGKLQRLHDWLAARGLADAARDQALAAAHFYSDSINDLPLLRAVGHPVVVDPDTRLLAAAQAAGWPLLQPDRSS